MLDTENVMNLPTSYHLKKVLRPPLNESTTRGGGGTSDARFGHVSSRADGTPFLSTPNADVHGFWCSLTL